MNQFELFDVEKPKTKIIVMPSKPKQIKHIHCDHKNKVTVVVFSDNSKEICRCSKEDVYNEYAGICICIAKHLYGKSKLDKIINSKKTVIYNNDNKEEK